jgi:hypothetical protein
MWEVVHIKKDALWIVLKDVMDVTKISAMPPRHAPAIVNPASRDATEESAMLHDEEVTTRIYPATRSSSPSHIKPQI